MVELNRTRIRKLISEAIDNFPHQVCETCECYLGFVTQIEMDSDPLESKFLEEHKPNRSEIHSCLGCDPCPPGDFFAEYLRSK